MQASRAVGFFIFFAAAIAGGVSLAASPAVVIDVDSGKVLYAERATDPWYPASITKLMTTYVALSAVRDGRVSFDTPLTISELAASMPPSKMGFPPGTEVTLDNALKIIMVKSANDIALTIAEGIGGSVDGFADMMNAAAQRLGMRESHFVNPHGLPDERNQTSARDMAILGRALLREFPQHAWYFNIGAIKFGRRVMSNHNGLVGRYPGVDGMKTGFICSGGFNVVASATRNGRRLITVVLGAQSAAKRTVRAAALMDRGFSSLGWMGTTADQLAASSLTSPPDMRPIICERHGPMPAEEDAQPAVTQSDDSGRLPTALAFSSAGSTPGAKIQLGPRAHFEPILVWTGRTPPSALASQNTDAPDKPKKAKLKQKPLSRAAKAGPIPASAKAFAATEPKSIMEDGKNAGNKGAIQPSNSLNNSAGKQGAGLGAIAAKPKATDRASANGSGDQKAATSPTPAAAKPAAPSARAKPVKTQAAKGAGQKPQVAAQAKAKSAAKPQGQ